MRVYLAASVGQLRDGKKERWFDSDICKGFMERGGKLGWEIKGSIDNEGIRTDRPYGIHLLYNVVQTWSRLDSRKGVELIIDRIANQKPLPDYVVFHGMEVGSGKKPFSGDRRFISTVGPKDYHNAFTQTVRFARELRKALPSVMVAIENTPLTDYCQGGEEKATIETRFCLRAGSWSRDLTTLAQTAKCYNVLDFEHLSFAQDFIGCRDPYGSLEAKIPTDISLEETALVNEGGPFLREGSVPVFPKLSVSTFEAEVERIRARIFHISGSSPLGKWQEIYENRIACHSPILPDDERVRRALTLLRKIQPDEDLTFVLEVCGLDDFSTSGYHPELWTIRSASQRESLEVFCQMLLEIWYS